MHIICVCVCMCTCTSVCVCVFKGIDPRILHIIRTCSTTDLFPNPNINTFNKILLWFRSRLSTKVFMHFIGQAMGTGSGELTCCQEAWLQEAGHQGKGMSFFLAPCFSLLPLRFLEMSSFSSIMPFYHACYLELTHYIVLASETVSKIKLSSFQLWGQVLWLSD